MDGWITIGTKLDTKGLEKDVKSLEKKLETYQKNSEKLTTQKAKYEADLTDYEKEIAEYDKLIEKAGQYERQIEQLKKQGYSRVSDIIPIQNELSEVNKQLDEQTPKIDETHMKYEQTKQEIQKINEELKNSSKQQQELTGEIVKANEKLGRTQGIKNLSGEVSNINGKMTGILQKVARWTLAVFSIRSIYSTLSSASATLSQYNEQYAANLQYIRYALAQMVAPILEYIVKLMYTILQYVNYIAQAWFGVNLFANASAKAFTNGQKATGSMAKNAEKIKKELQQAGFDEMNVLQDNTQSSTSGGAGAGAVAPTMDLSKMGDVEVPKWLQWIAEHKNEIIEFLKLVALLIAGIKIYELVKGIGELFGGITKIKALGITTMLIGVAYTISSIIAYLNDPSWKNFGKIITGVGISIAGLGLAIGSVPVAVAGAAVLITGLVVRHWDEIKKIIQKAIDWITGKTEDVQTFLGGKMDWTKDHFGDVGVTVLTALRLGIQIGKEVVTGFFTHIRSILDKIFSGTKQVLDGIIKIFKGDFEGGIKDVGEGIKRIFSGVWEAIWYKFTWLWEAILNAFKNGGQIFNGFKDGISDTFKRILNTLIDGINKVIKKPLEKVNELLNKIRGIEIKLGNLGSFQPFVNFIPYNAIPMPQIPKLARGTILNNPGNGVPVAGGRAIAGEAGREAYLPLSDKQLLEELGSTIGRYITINATVNNSMNGRLISRIMQEIKSEQDFAYNT